MRAKPQTLDDINRLINLGTVKAWRLASRGLWNELDAPERRHDAHFWMKLALVESLLKHEASQWHTRAKACPNYETHMEGDWLRDTGLASLRMGLLQEAKTLFNKAEPFHASANRKAVLKMAYGRLYYRQGELGEAQKAFREAHKLWASIPGDDPEPADKQWMINNAFHWFKLQVRVGSALMADAHELLSSDPSRSRRLRIAFIGQFGRLGNWLDDTLYGVVEALR